MKKHLYSDDGRLRSFVNVYVNDEDIRYLQKDQTAVRDGDTISIVPSIAGGARVNRTSSGDIRMATKIGIPAAADSAKPADQRFPKKKCCATAAT